MRLAVSRHSGRYSVSSLPAWYAAVLLAWALGGAAATAQQPATAPLDPPVPVTAPQDSQSAQPAQQSVPASEQTVPAQEPPANPPAAVPVTGQAPAAQDARRGNLRAIPEAGITEDEIKRLLVGKVLYLRGGYLDDSLSFNEHGVLIGHSAQGSYTLCGVQIDKVRLTKHKVELQGARYGLHFLGALAYEDPTAAVNRVRITPKKKMLKITIDREVVVKPKKEKQKKEGAPRPAPADAAKPSSDTGVQPPAAAGQEAGANDADETKAEIASAPPEERPADAGSVTTTTSPAHAAKVLKDALGAVFSLGLDERMMASMPDFWRLYYGAAAAKTDYRPKDAGVLRQNAVDTKAKLLTTFEPASNEFAQANGVAGMALYYAVIGADGKPGEVAVARPIGFGLDESAVEAIRNAKFEPAMKGGKPVPVLLDLVVQFRIYSKRTAESGKAEEADKPAAPMLPGPYSVQQPQPPQQQ